MASRQAPCYIGLSSHSLYGESVRAHFVSKRSDEVVKSGPRQYIVAIRHSPAGSHKRITAFDERARGDFRPLLRYEASSIGFDLDKQHCFRDFQM